MSCDICGKKGTSLVDLLDAYKTPEIQQICPDCDEAVNKHLWRLRGVTHNMVKGWMKQFMQNMKAHQ